MIGLPVLFAKTGSFFAWRGTDLEKRKKIKKGVEIPEKICYNKKERAKMRHAIGETRPLRGHSIR
jgi:hypothetical protein